MSQSIVRWAGRYLRIVTTGSWEYVERLGGMTAVVIVAMHDGKYILVEQMRVPLGGRRCIELPAGLVGDEDDKGIEDTAIKELEEETGFYCDRIERLGEFFSSPGMVAEGYTLVRAHGVRQGGTKIEDDIDVHLVAPGEVAAFIAAKRAEGLAIDTKLLLLLAGELLG
ncbi:MAG: NUDIX hydrolase [Sphingomonas bacterium]|nr:NUDIX hydrolase [Sphingomonas bacterium]